MSNTTTMPFQPTTLTEAPEAPEFDDSPGNRRPLLILGALAGLAVLAIAAYFLLFAGGSNDPAAKAVVPPTSQVQPSTAPTTAAKTAKIPKISKRNFGTDPFKDLIVDTTAATTTGTTTAGATTTGTTTAPTTTAPTTTTGTTTPNASHSYRFRVVTIAANNSTVDVKVDGKLYRHLKAGQVFAQIFKVRGISAGSAYFQIGDLGFQVNGTKAITISP
jgi:multidrug efflux pump subunit AcrA (membrane-fusion protein)